MRFRPRSAKGRVEGRSRDRRFELDDAIYPRRCTGSFPCMHAQSSGRVSTVKES